MSTPKILSADMRVQLILSTVEEAMTKISRIGRSPTRIPLTDAAIEKRHREAREELRREVARLVRGRGRDMLSLVREFAIMNAVPTLAAPFADFEAGNMEAAKPGMIVHLDQLLAVIDAGFVAEDEPVAGERCPLCERGMTEHTRIDLYGTDAFLCSGSTRDGVVVSIAHPQALARLHDAAQREAQRQFDELTAGSEARRKAEDYAAILDALVEVPLAQLEGLEWEQDDAEFAPIIRQLLTRGPLLERERLEAVFRDAVRSALETGIENGVYLRNEGSPEWSESEFIQSVGQLLANVLKGIFPVRVEYVSQDESERVERARKEPPPPVTINGSAGYLRLPEMIEGQTHWLIGNDYGLFYKVDAEGNVTRLENERTASFAPEDVQPGESYTAEQTAGDELATIITAVSDESSVKITDAE